MSSKFGGKEGFGVSGRYKFNIPSGEDGSNVDPVDLSRVYAWLVIRVADVTGFQLGTTASIYVGVKQDDTLVPLVDDNIPFAVDATGQFIIFAFAKRVRIVLDTVTDDVAVIEIYGADAAKMNE
jgi:hypothetical protein